MTIVRRRIAVDRLDERDDVVDLPKPIADAKEKSVPPISRSEFSVDVFGLCGPASERQSIGSAPKRMGSESGHGDMAIKGQRLKANVTGRVSKSSGRGRAAPAGDASDRNPEREGGSNGIRAMLVGLEVLQAVARERRPMPLRDVAEASGLTPSRVHRYLSSLVASKFIEQDSASGLYSLGEAVVEVGLLALGQIDTIQIGTDALTRFSEETGLDCHLSVWGSFGPTVVRWQSGRRGHQFRIEEGRVLPLLWSATGRVLMAYRNFNEVAPLLEPELSTWNRAHPDRKINRRQIQAMLSAVQKFGFSAALPHGVEPEDMLAPVFPRTYRHELETVAFPIFDHLHRAPMALTAFGGDSASDTTDKDELIDRLRGAAQAASRRIGGYS